MSLNKKYIFIITYARSGSTLLQGVLNTFPNSLIVGENKNFIYHLYHSYNNLFYAKKTFGNNSSIFPTSPWYGANNLNPEIMINDIRELIHHQIWNNTTATILGFKEIRYNEIETNYFNDYFNFLKLLFPNCIFIFHTRNLNNVAVSKIWSEKPYNNVINYLKKYETNVENYVKSIKHNDYVLTTYENLVDDPIKTLQPIAEKINIELDKEKIIETMKIKHSF